MKARSFSNKMKEAGLMLAAIQSPEPDIIVRNSANQTEMPVKAVKFRRGKIVIEF